MNICPRKTRKEQGGRALKKSLKESRTLGIALITFIYLAAGVLGIFVFRSLPYAWWLSLLIADVAATVFVFLFSLLLKNASVYDPYWSVQPPVILIALAMGVELNAYGILLLSVVLLWAIRLTVNWGYTFHSFLYEDWRYRMLREKTGIFYPVINFVGIHMVPTLVVYAATLPAAYAVLRGVPLLLSSALVLFLSVFAVLLQTVSDVTMHAYRRHRDAAFCRHGFWHYSRHPNYLGEILFWWGIALSVVIAVPHAYYLALGAFLNTALFLFVSIPMADRRQSKKEGFAEYKAETRALLPLPKHSRSHMQ